MSYIPSPKQAEELVKQYNKEAFHIQHAETVSKVMGEFAKEYDPERVDFWRTVGMLHDIDFELYPELASFAMAMASVSMWHRKNTWRRFSLPRMSLPV